MQHRFPRAAAVCLALAGLTGCAGFSGQKTSGAAVSVNPQPDLGAVSALLQMMSTLAAADPARQAEIFESAKDGAALSPTPDNKLKFALALATPGHSGTDSVAAQRQLAELLARPETLSAVERLLALVELEEVEQRLVLQAENKRLREDAPPDWREKLLVANRRLAAESDDNAKLRKALDEARAKIEAVTHIERSINDRGTGAPPPP